MNIDEKSKSILALVAFALSLPLLSPNPLAADAQTIGDLFGLVTDTAGNRLDAIQVSIFFEDRVTPFATLTTDISGSYRFNTLQPGRYRIRAEKEGYSTYQLAIDIEPGRRHKLRILMLPEKVAPQPATTPVLKHYETTQALSLKGDELFSLPLKRRYEETLILAPSISGEKNPMVRGATPRDNRFYLDGIDITDPLDGLLAADVPFEAISNATVDLGTADAGGASVNVVTRSGSNALHGEINVFRSSSEFNDENDPLIADEERRELSPSFSIGGPIRKDRLWFFGALTYLHADSKDSKGRVAPEAIRSPLFNGKMSWRLSNEWQLEVNYLGSFENSKRHWAPDAESTNIAETNLELITADLKRRTHAYRASATGRLSPSMTFQGSLSFYRQTLNQAPTNGNTSISTVKDPIGDEGTWLYQGSDQPSWRRDTSDRFNAVASLRFPINTPAGYHDIEIAAELKNADLELTSGFNGGYYYEFSTPADRLYRRFSLMQDSSSSILDRRYIRRYNLLLRDNWSLSPRMSIVLGINAVKNTGSNDHAQVFRWNSVSLQAGVVADVFGDGMTLARASYRKHYSPILGVYIPANPYELITEYLNSATGSWSTSSLNNMRQFGYSPISMDSNISPPYWEEWVYGLERELPGAIALSLNYTYRRNRNLFEDIETNLWPNYIIEETIDLSGNKYEYFVLKPGLDGTRNPILFLKTLPELQRKYRSIELMLRADLSPELKFYSAFTWSRSEGNIDNTLAESTGSGPAFNSPNERINTQGFLSSDRRYSLRAATVYAAPKGFYASLLLRLSSGTPLDRLLLNPNYGRYEIRYAPRGIVYRAQSETTIDLRIEKVISLPRGMFSIVFDVFNLANDDAPISYVTSDENFGAPLIRRAPREIRWGLRYIF